MADRGGEFNFLKGIHMRTDIRIDISISIRSMANTFGKQVHIGEMAQMRLVKQVLLTSSRQDHQTN